MPTIYRHEPHDIPPQPIVRKQPVRHDMLINPEEADEQYITPVRTMPARAKRRLRRGRIIICVAIVALLGISATLGIFYMTRSSRGAGNSDILEFPSGGPDSGAGLPGNTTDEGKDLDTEQDEDEDDKKTGPTHPYEVSLRQDEEEIWRLTINGNEMVLVNKQYHLTPEFGNGITDRTYQAYMDMAKDAEEAGFPLLIISGYRSYQDQASTFQYWVGQYGSEEEANRVSARPGQSEHQTGLAIDIGSTWEGEALSHRFAQTGTGQWLAAHSKEYGFILRYPEGKEPLTGYKFEPWHFRYVGTELATTIMDSGLCIEEFLAYVR